MKYDTLRVSENRLLARIEALGEIGATPEGGVRRLALTDEDKAGRDKIVEWMKAAALDIHVDQVGNIIGVRGGQKGLAPVMTGSHIDTVYNGGNLDGNLGVLAGLEVIETLNDANIETRHPLAVAVFTNEEGARFQPDMMGSLVYAGGLGIEDALSTEDDKAISVREELERIGYAGDTAPGDIVPQAFVELHIEQGPLLEETGVTLGAVQDLQGIS